MSTPDPLVSVGIPTYSRAASLERAVRSVLAQTHPNVEVVVCDDASPDDTLATLARLRDEDDRLRFERNDRNLGHAGNFKRVMALSRGDYFMWLSDDDWLDPEYVAECLRVHREQPGHALVAGQGRYSRDGEFVVAEKPQTLLDARPLARVVRYFARVNMNGLLFGLGPRELFAATPFKQTVGGDWLTVATFAYRGRVTTLEHVHVNRSIAGLSEDPQRLARSFGLSGARARFHHGFLAADIVAELGWREPAYRSSPFPARLFAGLASGALVFARYSAYRIAGPLGLVRLATAVRDRLTAPK